MRALASSNSSHTVSAAITVRRASPISPNLPAQLANTRFHAFGKLQEPDFLTFLAGHAILPAVDGDVDVAHSPSPVSSTARIVPIAASSFSAISRLVRSSRRVLHQRAVEFVGEPRPIGAERLDPARQLVLVAIGIALSLGRSLEGIERQHQPPRCGIDVGIDRLGITRPVGVTIAHGRQRAPWMAGRTAAKLAVRQAVRGRNLRGKRAECNAAAKLCTARSGVTLTPDLALW